jgi:uncharacterized membrane protein (UPF0127 family)
VASDGRTVAEKLEGAFDSAARKRGLLGRRELAPGTAILIAPCSAVHTFGMQFAIDVIFASRDGRVIKLRRAVAPGRIAVALRAFAVIEMAAGSIDRAGVAPGDHLRVTPA